MTKTKSEEFAEKRLARIRERLVALDLVGMEQEAGDSQLDHANISDNFHSNAPDDVAFLLNQVKVLRAKLATAREALRKMKAELMAGPGWKDLPKQRGPQYRGPVEILPPVL